MSPATVVGEWSATPRVGSPESAYDCIMRIRRSVGRYLEERSHWPRNRPDFTSNYLSANLKADDDRLSAFLCAVPEPAGIEDGIELARLAEWLSPTERRYEPKGDWLPQGYGSRRYTSDGVLLVEEYNADIGWNQYLLAGRDGYLEYGAIVGRTYENQAYFSFAPLVALIHRFTALVMDCATNLADVAAYWMVLNIPGTKGARVWALGDGWADQGHHRFSELPNKCLEPEIQLVKRVVCDGEEATDVGIWFAERIGNAFGYNEPSCYNRSDGTTLRGELPNGKILL